MRKIPTIFKRNPENMREILNEPHPDCLWVFEGEGIATRKYDGTCCAITSTGGFFKRREVKLGKPVPREFELIETDSKTGKSVGWVPVDPDSKEDRWHREAYSRLMEEAKVDMVRPIEGTYELVGPKIQKNPEQYIKHTLIRHANADRLANVPRDFAGLKVFLSSRDIEGIVFHHPDGRMGKIKKRDFGLLRKPE